MANETAKDYLATAESHLLRVQAAWDDPTDWADLSLYGFHRLEACVTAATIRAGLKRSTRHYEKQANARTLASDRALPDVGDLLSHLNDARKAYSYGDIDAPELNPEDVANEITAYYDAVQEFVRRA